MGDDDQYLRLLGALQTHVVEVDSGGRVVFENRNPPRYRLGLPLLAQLGERARLLAEEVIEAVRDDGVARRFEVAEDRRAVTTWVSRIDRQEGGYHFCLATEPSRGPSALEDGRKLEVALRASGVGLWSWHLPSNQVVWDERMREVTGRSLPLTLPAWIEELSHPDDRDRLRQEAADYGALGDFVSGASRILRDDGEVRWVITAGTVLPGENGKPEWLVGGLMDVTEQQRMAQKLQDAHKMEALGHLTGGVAHNFNNMLMIIQPCLESIQETAQGALLEDVNDALRATQRAADIVAELMTFSGRNNVRERVDVLASDLCLETIRLCRRSFPEDIPILAEIETAAVVECVPGSIEQVLGNILFNARDAIREAGKGAGQVVIVAEDVEEFDEQWVKITVSDDGPGVSPSLRSKIFEPFMTTKQGRGTGLGLASSMAIVQQHGGQLAYRPSKEGGAEFLILLPRKRLIEPVSERSVRADPPTAPERSIRRVLVVDDEPSIRRLLVSGLPRHGYEVVAVEGLSEAEITLERDNAFSLVLLDRSLGSDDGVQLVPLLRERCVHAKIYFFTGEFVSSAEASQVEGVIQKPLNIQALAQLIDEATSA